MQGAPQYSSARVLGRFVLEAMREAVVVVGPEGHVIEWNRTARAERYLGVIAALGAHGANEATLAFLNQAWHQGRALLELELPGASPDAFQLEAFSVELWIVVVIRDDGDRRRLESELRQLRRVESLGLLTASVIHDFNNLMTPMLALSSTLAGELRASSPIAEFAADIESVASRSAALLRELVATARALPLPLEPIDLNAVVSGLGPLIARVAGTQVRLVVALASQPTFTLADRPRLEHALLNLVANARNAMPNGGELRIATSFGSSAAGAGSGTSEQDQVVLVVSDDGEGMTEAVRERACDDFFTTREATGGSGLGLASVRRFVSESGGSLWLESEPEHGTTVTLRLPRFSGDA